MIVNGLPGGGCLLSGVNTIYRIYRVKEGSELWPWVEHRQNIAFKLLTRRFQHRNISRQCMEDSVRNAVAEKEV